jgi:sec-independent protein translocase protein TatB
MFDVGFWELLIIGIVALLVIGPERLPAVARTAGAWFGRAKRFIAGVKQDIDQELRADELKRILNEQNISNPTHSFLEDTKEELKDISREVDDAVHDMQKESKITNQPGQ